MNEYIIEIMYPEGERSQVIVRASSPQAAEQAAARKWAAAGASFRQVGPAANYPPTLLQQIRSSGGFLDATAPVNTNPTAGATDRLQGITPPPKDPNAVFNPKDAERFTPLQTGPGTPGYTSLPPGGAGNSSQGVGFGGSPYLSESDELSAGRGRFGSFQRALSRTGRNAPGVFGEQFRNQFDPYERAFDARIALGHLPAEGTTEPFGQFVQNTGNPFQSALGSFRDLRGLDPAAATTSDQAKAYLRPSTREDFGAAQGLFGNALQGRVGGAAYDFLKRFIPRAADEFSAGSDPDFLGTLMRRLGLQGAF